MSERDGGSRPDGREKFGVGDAAEAADAVGVLVQCGRALWWVLKLPFRLLGALTDL